MVFEDRMSSLADYLAVIIEFEAFRTEGDTLVESDMLADDAGFADDKAGAVVDAEVVSDLRAGMDVDSGGRMSQFGDDAGQERDARLEQCVREAVMGHGDQCRVAEYHFFEAAGGRVSVEDGFDIGAELAAKLWQLEQEAGGGFLSESAEVIAVFPVKETFGPDDLAA